MTEFNEYLPLISDDKPVRLFLPLTASDDRLLLQCVLRKTTTNHFLLLFKPGTLPVDKIDHNTSCLTNVDVGGQSISVESKITQVVNNQTLEMVPQKTISHEQMREYSELIVRYPYLSNPWYLRNLAAPETIGKFQGLQLISVDQGCGPALLKRLRKTPRYD